jgi:hypothetical protein
MSPKTKRRDAMTPNQRALLDAKKAAWELTIGTFFALLKQECVRVPHREYPFHPTRAWRFDFAWPRAELALECDGAIWTQGRHSRGSGILKEHEKFNAAAVLGWRVLRCTPDTLVTLDTVNLVRDALRSPLDAGGRE